MAVNLNKYKDSLIAAWKDVLDDKTKTNWALFGYEGQTNDLKVVSKGSDGIEELTEDLNSGKIMYAFLRVIDHTTSLPKSVLINWQGEGAPNNRKGTCANHIRDIGNCFKGAHVTINARTEEEVDPAIIMDKVAKASASVYKFNERTDNVNDSGPVGTTYKRTIPKHEINADERDRFWEQQAAEETQRQESERRRVELERKKSEAERTQRDSEETARREANIKQTSTQINQIRQAEKQSYERSQVHIAKSPAEDLEKEELERRNRSEILRRQRSEEAQSLIAKRTVDARAIFEKNTAAGQLQRKTSLQPRISEPKVANTEPVVKNGQGGQSKVVSEPVEPVRASNGSASVKNEMNGAKAAVSTEENNTEWEDEVRHDIPVTMAPAQFQDEVAPSSKDENGLSARALYDYQAADDTEITFDPGDVITHIDQIDEGWWQGLGPDGTFGLFPANYVELIN